MAHMLGTRKQRREVGSRSRAGAGVPVRAALVAGVAAVGITVTLPCTVTPAPALAGAAVAVAAPAVSTQEVALTAAYVPYLYDIGSLVLDYTIRIDSLLTSGVDLTTAVVKRIPAVAALAPQIDYIYFCTLRSFVYYPVVGSSLFAMTLDPVYLLDVTDYLLARSARFVEFQLDYFLNLPAYLLGLEFLPAPRATFAAPAGLGVLSAVPSQAVTESTLVADDNAGPTPAAGEGEAQADAPVGTDGDDSAAGTDAHEEATVDPLVVNEIDGQSVAAIENEDPLDETTPGDAPAAEQVADEPTDLDLDESSDVAARPTTTADADVDHLRGADPDAAAEVHREAQRGASAPSHRLADNDVAPTPGSVSAGDSDNDAGQE